ncbi:hypothetical protein J4468_04150 [Candidatus Woesearchaeota archaeon]|nr:hypothetical protein [Candidatus Woesearchaeota archaeon]
MNNKGQLIWAVLLFAIIVIVIGGVIYYNYTSNTVESLQEDSIMNNSGSKIEIKPSIICNESNLTCIGTALFICINNNWTKTLDCPKGCDPIAKKCIEIKENLDILGLEDYPEPFIINGAYNSKNKFIVGDKGFATDSVAVSLITSNLQFLSGNNQITPLLILTSEVTSSNIANSNLILVGDPCRNDLVREYLGLLKCEDWAYPAGKGVIKFYEDGGYGILIVAGKTADDVLKAAKVISNHNQYSLKGSEALVSGTKDNPIID